MNKFAKWMESGDRKQRSVAEKLGISYSSLNDIIRKGHVPSLKTAYAIEIYTRGAVTLYDWVDDKDYQSKNSEKNTAKRSASKIKAANTIE